jgi:hypothetical protein
MLAFPPRLQRIPHVLVGIAMFSACAKKEPANHEVAEHEASPPAAPVVLADAAAATADAEPGSHITISVAEPRVPGHGLARRCVLGGDPLTSDCIAGGSGVAFDKAGTLYIVAGTQVRRYKRAAGEAGDADCHYEPAGAPIELPPDNPRPQSLDGPVYMRSGGAAWHLTATADAIYVHDYLGGLFRIDRGKAEPACVDVFGFSAVAARGKQLLISRKGIEQLSLGKKCVARSAKIDDKARGDVYVVHDHLYTANVGEITRYDDKTAVKLGEGTRICSSSGFTACGDGACIADNNCMQIVQLAADGKVQRVLDDDTLFDVRPWSLEEATTRDDGSVFIYARHRDAGNGKQICETAIYELPAALFAP